MKKIGFILSVLFFLQCIAYEDIPIFPQDSGVNILYVEDQRDLINLDGMKKADKVKKAENAANENTRPKIRFDTRQIIHQRALDYTTNQNNLLRLPTF